MQFCTNFLLYRSVVSRYFSQCSRRCFIRKYNFHNISTAIQKPTDFEYQRNIGIIAHIDAGKTTTTERLLFHSGFISTIGNVDDGDTVTDYMEQERARGITITSAAVSFMWRNHKINLIDTPGHVDFTLEVGRSLRVLDGVVTVIDASAGVEAQTLTVWQQAGQYNLPSIVFINKMDKRNSDFIMSVSSVKEKLKLTPLLLQLPIGYGSQFEGMLDLLSMKKYDFTKRDKDGKFGVNKLTPDNVDYNTALEGRRSLLEQLADYDDTIADHVLNEQPVMHTTSAQIISAVRHATLQRYCVPVVCGSALKNVGIQMLLDAISLYLPSPTDRDSGFVQYYEPDLCALAFKTVYDNQRGPLTFVRVYSGALTPGQTLYNGNQQVQERVGKILQIQANEWRDLKSADTGSIVAITALRQTATGDLLMAKPSSLKRAVEEYKKQHGQLSDKDGESTGDDNDDGVIREVLPSLSLPEPVFFRSIEPPSLAQQKALDTAISNLTREDPSLTVRVDQETGQTVLGGMGELHLEIVKDRILKEYRVDAYMGPLQIAYREMAQKQVTDNCSLQRRTENKQHEVYVELTVAPDPDRGIKSIKHLNIEPTETSSLSNTGIRNKQHHKAVLLGIEAGLQRGALLGAVVCNTTVILHDLRASYHTPAPMITACVAQCIYQALKQADSLLLQPYMKMNITVSDEYASAVIGDLTQRNSTVEDVSRSTSDSLQTITALTPLAQLVGYSTYLRTVTSGTAVFNMQLSDYHVMNPSQQSQVIQEMTGFCATT